MVETDRSQCTDQIGVCSDMTSDCCVGSSGSQIEHSCTTIMVMLTAVWDVHNVIGIVVKLLCHI